MKLLAGAMALIIAAASVVGVVSPLLVLELAQSLLAPGSLYVVAAVRIIFGTVLVSVASMRLLLAATPPPNPAVNRTPIGGAPSANVSPAPVSFVS